MLLRRHKQRNEVAENYTKPEEVKEEKPKKKPKKKEGEE